MDLNQPALLRMADAYFIKVEETPIKLPESITQLLLLLYMRMSKQMISISGRNDSIKRSTIGTIEKPSRDGRCK